MPQTTTTPSSYPSYVYTNENNRIGLPARKRGKENEILQIIPLYESSQSNKAAEPMDMHDRKRTYSPAPYTETNMLALLNHTNN